jgi:uncharacterized protein YcbX
MERTIGKQLGSVRELWRYPVKSMLGEPLQSGHVTARGLHGDRQYAMIDVETGRVVSAKNPRRWPTMFQYRAQMTERLSGSEALTGVRITLSNGRIVTEADSDVDAVLSQSLGRGVRLTSVPPEKPVLEMYSPDLEDSGQESTEEMVSIPSTGFFDEAPVHLVTTATLDALRAHYAIGQFEVRRFRPNVVIAVDSPVSGFVENEWAGHLLAIGSTVRLSVTRGCPRCVMTTLPVQELPQDLNILRTIARHNQGVVGVLATVHTPGDISPGDAVSLCR